MASIYKRGKIWWIHYLVGSKPVQKSLDTTNEQVALKKKKQVEGLEATGQLDPPTRIPIATFLETFCDHLKERHTERAYKADISYLRSFFGPICASLKPGPKKKEEETEKSEESWAAGKTEEKKEAEQTEEVKEIEETERPERSSSKDKASSVYRRHVSVRFLEDVTPTLISHFIKQRVDNDGIAPKTANRFREVLHVMFNYAIKHEGFISPVRGLRNPAGAVERRPEPAPQIRFLDLKDIPPQLQALERCPGLRAAVAMMIFAGLRREECFWLTRDDVDIERRVIRVRAKTIDGKAWQPKTKKNRAVPISNALLQILGTYRPRRGDPWFFPAPRGKHWDPDCFSRMLRRVNKEAGLTWDCLDFRHTFGSHLAMKGESLYKISELMGNSPEICRRHYAALIPERMRDTVEFDQQAGTAQPAFAVVSSRARRSASR
jgi:integrase